MLEKIEKIVKEYYCLSSDLAKKTRKTETLKYRQITYYLGWWHKVGTFRQMGNYYGQCHATVLNAKKIIENELYYNIKFQHEIKQLRKLTTPGKFETGYIIVGDGYVKSHQIFDSPKEAKDHAKGNQQIVKIIYEKNDIHSR